MRTFGLTVYATLTAETEEAAAALVERRLPAGLGHDIVFDASELTGQFCVECWCTTTGASSRCDDCKRDDGRAGPGMTEVAG